VLGAVQDLAYLGIGTGISAGVVLDGRLHRGTRGLAGEIGHSVLDPDGPPCACGLRGCFEALAAGPAVARRAGALLLDGHQLGTATEEGRRNRRNGTPTAEDVYAAAAAGDPVGTQIADEVGGYVARAVHELVMAYDVEVVVLGGGVAAAGDAFLDPILRALDRLRARSHLAREVLTPGVVHLLPPSAEVGTWGAVTLAAEAERRAGAAGTGGRSAAAAATVRAGHEA
jgi:glucokinase